MRGFTLFLSSLRKRRSLGRPCRIPAFAGMTVLLLLSFPAFAACTSPSGVESQTQYDFTDHVLKYCDGTDWISVASGSGGSVPTGAIWAFDLASCPTGWTAYAPSSGRFLRGRCLPGEPCNDPDGTRTAGSTQADEFKSHVHDMPRGPSTNPWASPNYVWPYQYQAAAPTTGPTNPTGGAETRPKNVAVLYCRKD